MHCTVLWRPGAAGVVLAALAAALPAVVRAQSSVTLYGIVDVAVEHVTDVGAQKSGLTRVPSLTGSLPSRVGLRGSEDLGGGLRAVFAIEGGFAPDQGTSTQGGRFFGRQTFVGLSGPWGTLSLGRQYTMLFWSLLEADIMGPALYSSGSLDAYVPNARADNAVAWQGRFGGWMLGATYSFGRDTVNAGGPAGTNCPGEAAADRKACRQWSALVKYDSPRFGAAAAIDEIRGGAGAFGGLVRSDLKDIRLSVNGYVRLAGHKLAAGLIRRDNDASATAPRSDLTWVGGSFPLGSLTVDAQLFRLDFKGSDNAAVLPALRGTYRLSRRTAVYGMVGFIDNDGQLALSVSGGGAGSAPVAGGSQTGVGIGVLHSF